MVFVSWHGLSRIRKLFIDFHLKLVIIEAEKQGGFIENTSDLSPPFGRDRH